MIRPSSSSSWLDTVANLLDGRRTVRPHRVTRRLVGERLERRTVLSTAPIDDDASQGVSLAEYLEQEQQMGPIAPAEYSAEPDSSAVSDPSGTVEPAFADQVFDYYSANDFAEGEGEGEGEGSGSGSGSGEPTVEADTTTDENGETVVVGTASDDEGVEGLDISISSGSGTLTVDADGNFTITDGVPNDQGYIVVTVTDADGNTSEIFIYL